MDVKEETRETNDVGTRAPKVSVVIPAYNVAAYIAEALDSAFAQTFTDYEVIVVNDGSPDTAELERVLAPYRDRVRYIAQANRGVGGARNTLVRAARGEFVAQLDPDDAWLPHYLETQLAIIEGDSTIDVLYPNALIFGDGLDAGRTFMESQPSEGEVTFEALLRQRCTVMACVTARRATLVRAGLYDEKLRCSEDLDLWLRVVKAGGRIAYHRQVLARYRRRRDSLTADPTRGCRNALLVLDKCEREMELTESEAAAVREQRAHFYAMLRLHEGRRAFFGGDAPAAVAAFKEANAELRSRKLSVAVALLRVAPRLLLRAYDLRDRLVYKASTKS